MCRYSATHREKSFIHHCTVGAGAAPRATERVSVMPRPFVAHGVRTWGKVFSVAASDGTVLISDEETFHE
ncbi:hypothetical protein AA0472_1855 [Acetobacter estunensis NRIC 0472]|nr:hypothetical protein AA0472_1855 [Acetobacter estunensis NRIC 0472]